MFMCMWAYSCTCSCVHGCLHVHECVRACSCACVHVNVHVCVLRFMGACSSASLHVHVHACIFMGACMHVQNYPLQKEDRLSNFLLSFLHGTCHRRQHLVMFCDYL